MAKGKLRICDKCKLPTLMGSIDTPWTIIVTAEHNISKRTKVLKVLHAPCAGFSNDKE